MAQDFDARRLDIRRFAEAGGALAGDPRLGAFTRLTAETQGEGAERPVHWTAQGELRNPRHVQPEIWLHLRANAELPMVCQRCLRPVEVGVAVDRSFRFVADEATAAAEDDAAEEDVLALSRQFDLPELVEDELLMEMPAAPMHATCPVAVVLAVADQAFDAALAERENPFAALGAIKTGKK